MSVFGPEPVIPRNRKPRKCEVPILPDSADSVEKLATWRKVVAAASDLARCGLVAVPSSVQMMGFVG